MQNRFVQILTIVLIAVFAISLSVVNAQAPAGGAPAAGAQGGRGGAPGGGNPESLPVDVATEADHRRVHERPDPCAVRASSFRTASSMRACSSPHSSV